MGFLAVLCAFAMRMVLPLTIEQIVVPTNDSEIFIGESCPSPLTNSSASVKYHFSTIQSYYWDEYTQVIKNILYIYVLIEKINIFKSCNYINIFNVNKFIQCGQVTFL